MLNAVFLWQLLDEQSFFSAIRGVELKKLSHKPGEGDGPTWNDVYDDFESTLKPMPCLRPHFAAKQALASVIRAERGKQPASDLLPVVGQCREIDPGNWVIRLAQTCLADMARPPATKDAATTQTRFMAMKQIVEAAPPPDKSTLYNQEFTEAWHTSLKKYIKRADVAANVATGEQDPRLFVVEHYEAMPMIQRRLSDLSQALRKTGKAKEADTCDRWIAAMTLGLMQADKDAGTCLLCADLLSNSSKAGDLYGFELRRLKVQFHLNSAESPIDLTDQPAKRPSPAPQQFRWAVGSLGVALLFGLIGSGCAILICLAGIGRLVVRLLRRRGNVSPDAGAPLRKLAPIGMFVFSMAVVFAVGSSVGYYGWFSEVSLLFKAALVLIIGALLALARSALAQEFSRPRSEPRVSLSPNRRSFRLRHLLIALSLLFLSMICILPSAEVAQGLQRFGISTGPLLTLVLAIAAVLLGAATGGVPWRILLKACLLGWCVNMAAGLILLQYHAKLDSGLIQAVVPGRKNEVPARGCKIPERGVLAASANITSGT